eukprot:comp23608_c0_seq1/m.59032 comp23608_c0_seq1/g.59032  ORF comp23608_c0_seq1/g.59032 comp23608_c0_seq1/m.59032 type:complete len:173 (+) comp23608_c0_seq1:42-560(+)
MVFEVSLPEVVTTDAIHTVFVHFTSDFANVMTAMHTACDEVRAFLTARKIVSIHDSYLTHHLHSPQKGSFSTRVSFPVTPEEYAKLEEEQKSKTGEWGKVELAVLPARRSVRAVLTGDYAHLMDAWGSMMAWAGKHNFVGTENLWEWYFHGKSQESDPEKYKTFIVQPIAHE